MSAPAPAQVKSTPTPVSVAKPTGLASHTCACGGSHGLDGECAECRQKKLRVQRRPLNAPDLVEMHTPAALNYHFGRVSIMQAHASQRSGEQEARDEQEADRAAAQVLQGSEPLVNQHSTPLVIRRRALDEETSTESANTSESEVSEPAAATAETTPEVASPETESTPETGSGSEPATTESSAGETSTGGLIVEDDATPGIGQMSKTAFLDELRSSACTAADAELAAVGRSTEGCPYVERAIGYYSTKDSAHLERAMRKYAPETAGVTTAQEYIPLVTERIRQGVARWAQTGQITDVPEELLSQASTAGLLSGLGATTSAAASGLGGLFFKARAGGAKEADPQAIRSQLKSGRPLEGGTRTRMESAFGYDFSRVRVHTDGQAAHLSSNLNARAFTVGSDVAFGAGEYQPGTLVGDALLAHELAHVVQQGGADSSSAVMQKGGTTYNALEEDADASAVGAVVSMWSGAKSGLAKIAQSAMPHLKSGLRLQRCNSSGSSTSSSSSSSSSSPTASCSAANTSTRATINIQPIVVANNDGSNPTAAAPLTALSTIWSKCCMEFNILSTHTVNATNLKTLDIRPPVGGSATAEETALFTAAGTTSGIQIISVDQFFRDGVAGKNVAGGGKTYDAGTANPRIVVVTGVVPEVVAHEVGHATGYVGHDSNATVMRPTGAHDSPNSTAVSPDVCTRARSGAVLSSTTTSCCQDPT